MIQKSEFREFLILVSMYNFSQSMEFFFEFRKEGFTVYSFILKLKRSLRSFVELSKIPFVSKSFHP